MNLLQYTQKTKTLDVLALVEDCLADLDKKGIVTGLIHEQLEEGKRGDDTLMPRYSYLTLKEKAAKGRTSRTDRISLIDTGAFWKSMFTDIGYGTLSIEARDWKTDMLIDRYGKEILLISKSQLSHLATLVQPLLKVKIDQHYAQ